MIRTYKFSLKVSSGIQNRMLRGFSKVATAAYNHAAIVAREDSNHYQASIDRQFEEWKKVHPVEAAVYDVQMAEYRNYIEIRRMAKRGKCPYPPEVEYPKMPVEIHSEVKRRTGYDAMKKLWEDRADDPTTKVLVGSEEFPISGLYTVSQMNVIRTVDSAVSSAIAKRVQHLRASLPKEKPPYADTSFCYYKPQYNISVDGKKWYLELRVPRDAEVEQIGKIGWLKLRFFPTRKDFDPAVVKSVQIGRKRGTNDWWVCFRVRVPMSGEALPNRTVGVDINSGNGNTIVVADKSGEVERMAMPQHLEEIQKKIEKLQRQKSLALNENGENYKTRRVKTLSRRICRLHEKMANIRKNALHHMSKRVVHLGDVVSLENLDVKELTKSAKGTVKNPGKDVAKEANNNRRMLAVAPGMFRGMVEYKSHGLEKSKVVTVDPAWTSQTCCFCGQIGVRDKRGFKCANSACSVYDKERDADENAAMNMALKAEKGDCEVLGKPTGPTGYERAQAARKKKAQAAMKKKVA